jgi:uncharacterized membrane protein
MSLLLGWLAVAGFINAFAWKAAALAFDETLPPRLSVFIDAAQSWGFTILALAYGLTALAAAIGIWRLRPWMARAFMAWSLAVLTMFTWLLLVWQQELPAGGKTIAGLWLVGVAAALAVLYFYVRSIARGAQRAAA